jgi:toxin ParE1/3/4
VTLFKLSVKAKSDLKEIARYTNLKWGKEQRNRYIRELDACFVFVAQNPDSGISCNEIKKGYFKHSHGSHVIFYLKSKNQHVFISRILHKRMDYLTNINP